MTKKEQILLSRTLNVITGIQIEQNIQQMIACWKYFTSANRNIKKLYQVAVRTIRLWINDRQSRAGFTLNENCLFGRLLQSQVLNIFIHRESVVAKTEVNKAREQVDHSAAHGLAI